MQLQSLSLRNFRAFKGQTVNFEPGINLLIGDNATGKTTILDAARVVIGSWFLGFPDVVGAHISEYDVRRCFNRHQREFSEEPQWPVVILAHGILDDVQVSWTRKRTSARGRTDRIGARKLTAVASRKNDELREGQAVSLPVLAYFPAGRLWIPTRDTSDPKGPKSRLEGYRDCLKAAVDQQRVRMQWKKREMIGLQQGSALPQLMAVRNAVIGAIPDARNVYFDVNYGDIVVVFENGEVTPFWALSDGFRSTLTMIADIASRASTLNPHLGDRAAAESQGVILIDEIGLHLHPAWQRRILNDLRTIFPKMQFIVTTHAPQILVGSKPGELQTLRKRDGEIELIQEDIPPGLRADQVLTGIWFDLYSTLETSTLKLLDEHRDLLRISALTEQQEAQKVALETVLRERLGRFADTSMERMALTIIADITRQIEPTTSENRQKIRELAARQLKAKLDEHS